MEAYPGKIKLIFKEFPLDTHSQAFGAAEAAVAAQQQGKFWQMHDSLFAHRRDLSTPTLVALARNIGLDMNRFQTDFSSPATKKTILKDMDDGDKAGVEGTPSVFINGRKYNGSLDLEPMRKVIDDQLKKK